ncbi:MAG: fasciclin domain-containing protein, partial [Gemmatimonadetes bacterium]|nr:fasciclin domain-containing protein [Gemmatimonadota bacterium]
FTVFAPTDEAFAKLPKGTVESLLKPENRDQLVAVLTYHVVEGAVKAGDVVGLDAAETLNGQRVNVAVKGDNVMIDNAKVTATDIKASNGIIHVIDTVLLPESETIVGVASGNGSFGTLLAAAKAAGLAETLMGEGPFTVFAPTDEAFAKLPAGTVESLLKPENVGKLQNILKYHVVSGRIFSGAVVGADKVRTLSGDDVQVSMKSGAPMLDDAKIVATDIDASNGVIHVIDSVLIPAEKHTSVESTCTSGTIEI